MSIEVIKQALEALRFALHVGFDESSESQIKKGDKAVQQHKNAIAAIQEVLAQPQQEPVAWQFFQDGKWHNGMDTNNHRANTEAVGIITRDLYNHPAPTVVRQLVEALEDSEHYIVLDLARHDEAYDRHPSGERERSQIVQDLEKLRAALAAIKEAK